MKQRMALLLVAICLLTVFSHSMAFTAKAIEFSYGEMMDMFSGLLADEDDDDDTDTKNKMFTGPMVTVKVGNKKVKVHQDFKEAMDDYEEFFDKYIEVMDNPDEKEYVEFMMKYTDYMNALDSIAEYDLTDSEMAYYLKVYGRITDKLVAAAQ